MEDRLSKLEKLNSQLEGLDERYNKFKDLTVTETVCDEVKKLARSEMRILHAERSILRGKINSSQVPNPLIVGERLLKYYKKFSSLMESAYFAEFEGNYDRALSFFKDADTIDKKIYNLEDVIRKVTPNPDPFKVDKRIPTVPGKINFTLVLDDIFPPEVIDFETKEKLDDVCCMRNYLLHGNSVWCDSSEQYIGRLYRRDE